MNKLLNYESFEGGSIVVNIFYNLFKNLKIRWKLLIIVLPIVVIPIIVVSNIIGYIAYREAYTSVNEISRIALDNIASFTLDLLNSYHQQFYVYKEEKKELLKKSLANLCELSYNLVESLYMEHVSGKL